MIIGVTGNIGSGKSLACRLLAELGAAVIDADQVGHSLLLPEGAAYQPLLAAFGDSFLDSQGRIDRRALGGYIFADSSGQRTQQLNAITHPLIRDAIRHQLRDLEQQGRDLIVIEAALLLDSPLASLCHQVWLITAERETLLQRVQQRDHCSRQQAEQRLAQQAGEQQMAARCQRIFFNNGDAEALRQQLTQACAELRS